MPLIKSENWSAVDQYLASHLIHADEDLNFVLSACDEAGLPRQSVSALQGKFLNLLVKLKGAKRILEIGTLGGYSAIWLASALPQGGRLITLEYNPLHLSTASMNLKKVGLLEKVTCRLGRAADSLQKLIDEKVEPFDMIFIDADKPNYPTYLELSLKLTKPGTLIVLDNMIREGTILEMESRATGVVGRRKTVELISQNPRLKATSLQTVGEKGHDGFVFALVE